MNKDYHKILISVIIPYSQGHEKNLDNTLFALSNQTYLPNEIIIVGDGVKDSDNVLKLINKNIPSLKDIKYIWSRKWKFGQDTVPRNQGARLAKNKYLLFIDCDILLGKNSLEEYAKSFIEHPDCIILGRYDWMPPMDFQQIDIKNKWQDLVDWTFPINSNDTSHNQIKDIRGVSFNEHSKDEEIFDDNSAGLGCFGGNLAIPFNVFWKIGGFNDRFTPGLCIGENEKIIIKKNGNIQLKKIKYIKIGDKVLSYNFNKQKHEFKKCLNVFNKGKKSVVKSYFRNGTSIISTLDHKFFDIHGKQKKLKQIKKYIETKHNSASSSNNMVLCSKEFEEFNNKKLDKNICYILGIFIAEGCIDKGIDYERISIACKDGNKFKNKIRNKLKKAKIDFFEDNYRFRFSIKTKNKEIGKLLKQCGKGAYNKKFPNKVFSLNKKCLNYILEGYSDGDAHLNARVNDKRGYDSNRFLVHNTISNTLAEQLGLIHLILGRPLHFRLADYNHSNMINGKIIKANYPIWRLTENLRSHFKLPAWFNGRIIKFNRLSKVSIKKIENIDEQNVYDIEIEDNHNFILSNGVLTHNCDDGSFGLNAVFNKVGIVFNKDILGLHQYHTRNVEYVVEQSKKEVVELDKIFGLNGNSPDPLRQKPIYKLTQEAYEKWGYNPPVWINEMEYLKINKD